MQVRCTTAWWHNRKLIPAGAVIDVPKGTPVPQGFFVDGVEIPRKKKGGPSSKDMEIEALKVGNEKLNKRVLELEAELVKANAPKVGRPPFQRHDKEK